MKQKATAGKNARRGFAPTGDFTQKDTKTTKVKVSGAASPLNESRRNWPNPFLTPFFPSSFPSFASVKTLFLLLLLFTTAALCAAETPRRGGTLRLARPADLQSIDPAICFDGESMLLTRLIFQGLVDFDEQSKIVPKQAIDWNVSADRKTYTFHLRPGVRFANGREVEASDYVYSLQRIIGPRTESPGESYFNGIAGARDFHDKKTNSVSGLRAPAKHTLEIELSEPDFAFEFKMAMTFACAVPREAIEEQGSRFWLHAFGSGPYRIIHWTRGVRMELERSAAVNQNDEGYFEGVDVMMGGDRTLHSMMLDRGELDVVHSAPIPDIVRLTHNPLSKEVVHTIDLASTGFLYLNTELPPFNTLEVRQAINHAIDKQRLVTFTAHTAVAARSILPPLMLGFNPEQRGLEFDPAKSKQLLRDAGFPDGLSFELWYSDDDPRMVMAMESDLRAVGITAKLKKVNLAALLTAMQTRRAVPCAFSGWGQDYPDPSNFLDVLFNGTSIQDFGGNNGAYYNNPEVNRLLAEAGRITVPSERYRRYQHIENLILQDAPVVPLVHAALPALISPRIGGFRPHPVWAMRPEHWWAMDSPKK
jgi:ABC-type transport system substrate-binding protein